jgi:hypothetical protein
MIGWKYERGERESQRTNEEASAEKYMNGKVVIIQLYNDAKFRFLERALEQACRPQHERSTS